MKKLLLLIVASIILLSPVCSKSKTLSDKIVKPPKEASEMVGKMINFTCRGCNEEYSLLVVGVSTNQQSFSEATYVYVSSGIEYYGLPIKKIFYYTEVGASGWKIQLADDTLINIEVYPFK